MPPSDSIKLFDFLAVTEPFSSFSHLLGSAGALVGTIFLLHHAKGRIPRLVSFAVFGFVTSGALALSGVYHLLEPGTMARTVFQRMDHAAIWLMIAATFTPIHRLLFHGFARWGVLLIVWLCAIVGIALKTVYFNSIPNWLGVAAYCALGSVGVWSYMRIRARFGTWLERPFFWAGMFYIAGALLEGTQVVVLIPGVIGPHELMHIAVLIGLTLQWVMMVRVADLLARQDEVALEQKKRLKMIRNKSLTITDSGVRPHTRTKSIRENVRSKFFAKLWKQKAGDGESKPRFRTKSRRPYWRIRKPFRSRKEAPEEELS